MKTKHVGVRFHPDIHRRMKMLCVMHDLTLQDFIEQAALDRVQELERQMRGKE